MTQPDISGIAPFFIVRNVPAALSFYRDRLGFDITFQGAEPDDIFFGIVQRGAAMIMFKDVGVDPVPNYTRDVKKGIARWDAYLHVPDPDALAAEFSSRQSSFPNRSKIPMMACVDSNSRTMTATSCSSAVLVHERRYLASERKRRANRSRNPHGAAGPGRASHAEQQRAWQFIRDLQHTRKTRMPRTRSRWRSSAPTKEPGLSSGTS